MRKTGYLENATGCCTTIIHFSLLIVHCLFSFPNVVLFLKPQNNRNPKDELNGVFPAPW